MCCVPLNQAWRKDLLKVFKPLRYAVRIVDKLDFIFYKDFSD